MSELITARRIDTRLQLLNSVSALVLLVAASTTAKAEGTDRPTVWIELGGQLERVDGGQERFAPPFLPQIDTSVFTSPLEVQRPPRYSTGFEGSLTFQPGASDWVFSAAIRYGRSNGGRKLHQEGPLETAENILSVPLFLPRYTGVVTADSRRYSDTTVKNNESHAIIDFQAGKDVGLGVFGPGGTSVLSVGVRIAQFTSRSTVSLGANPDFAFTYDYASTYFGFPGYFKVPLQHWHLDRANADITRSFHGIGPSVAWDATARIAGNPDRMELMFDWGVNAAILFGRQKMNALHETKMQYRPTNAIVSHNQGNLITTFQTTVPTARSRSVTVPNVGGFAGFSLKFPNAKVSLGYRADMFFGAIDGGIDTHKTYDRAFYGPFASFSMGLGG